MPEGTHRVKLVARIGDRPTFESEATTFTLRCDMTVALPGPPAAPYPTTVTPGSVVYKTDDPAAAGACAASGRGPGGGGALAVLGALAAAARWRRKNRRACSIVRP
jgi:uncharacterized protein (TIGR03382 family)